jgi:hypothetical protein
VAKAYFGFEALELEFPRGASAQTKRIPVQSSPSDSKAASTRGGQESNTDAAPGQIDVSSQLYPNDVAPSTTVTQSFGDLKHTQTVM